MSRGLIFSFLFHTLVIFITALTLPFMMREPIDVPPIVSVELIQIKDKTFIPYAPKARKIIEETKKKEERVVSEQAPPAAKAKEKPDRIPLPDDKKEKKQIVKKKQNPEEIKPQIRQSSEFEKKGHVFLVTNDACARKVRPQSQSLKASSSPEWHGNTFNNNNIKNKKKHKKYMCTYHKPLGNLL